MLYNFISKMISDTAGKKAKPYFSFIFSLFVFVLFCNMVGMLPYSFTVTSHIIVTLAFAMFIFVGVTILGFVIHGFNIFFSLKLHLFYFIFSHFFSVFKNFMKLIINFNSIYFSFFLCIFNHKIDFNF